MLAAHRGSPWARASSCGGSCGQFSPLRTLQRSRGARGRGGGEEGEGTGKRRETDKIEGGWGQKDGKRKKKAQKDKNAN